MTDKKVYNDSFVTFSRPFIKAANNVFETMVFTKILPGRPVFKNDDVSKGDVSSLMGTSGIVSGQDGVARDYKGMLVISWPFATYVKMASAMLMEEFTEYSDEISDVGSEISNMIMGNAKRELKVLGYSTNMAIPSSITGPGHTLKYPQGTKVILIPVKSDHGNFFIELCYKE